MGFGSIYNLNVPLKYWSVNEGSSDSWFIVDNCPVQQLYNLKKLVVKRKKKYSSIIHFKVTTVSFTEVLSIAEISTFSSVYEQAMPSAHTPNQIAYVILSLYLPSVHRKQWH